MPKDRFKLVTVSHLFLVRDGNILLLQRQNTGYEDGNYSVPAGHKDADETVTQAMIREAKEEAGIIVRPQDLKVVHVMNRKSDHEEIDFFLYANQWEGEPKNMEPEKCGDLSWFPLAELPENVILYIRAAISSWQQGIYYSEFGYD